MPKPFKQEQFGRYLLTERIAIGGMAEIFIAKVFGAMGFEKSLVIKRILPQFAEDTEFLRMFITEAKLVCHLEHPNIVQVHDLGEIDGQYYIAMEYVNGIDGRHLWRTLAKRKQRLPGLLAIFIVPSSSRGWTTPTAPWAPTASSSAWFTGTSPPRTSSSATAAT